MAISYQPFNVNDERVQMTTEIHATIPNALNNVLDGTFKWIKTTSNNEMQ